MSRPNCSKCKHFFVTYDPRSPRGCKAYGIQTAGVPSQIIKAANKGEDCLGFSPKKSAQEKAEKKDLNDPKYWSA